MNEAFFVFSLILGSSSIGLLLKQLDIPGKIIPMVFIPFTVVYLGLVSTILSMIGRLDSSYFLILQSVLLTTILLVFGTKKVFVINLQSLPRQFVTRIKFDPLTMGLSLLVGLLLMSSLLLRINEPVYGFDDLTYRASTPVYWIQHHSTFPFETVNQRKNVLAPSTSLIYMWPLLFGVTEQWALLFYWLAYPVTALAIYQLSALFLPQPHRRLLVLLIWLSSPIIFKYFTYSLTQEQWLAPMLISFIYLIWLNLEHVRKHGRSSPVPFWIIGWLGGVLVWIKLTALVYLLIPLLFVDRDHLRVSIHRLYQISIGFFASVALSGFIVTLFLNTKLYNYPFGTAEFRYLHLAPLSVTQIGTYALRIPFIFFDPPLFSTTLAEKVSPMINSLADRIGATRHLADEGNVDWIGYFTYSLDWPNRAFGLLGLLVLYIFSWLLWRVLWQRHYQQKRPPLMQLSAAIFLTLFIQLLFTRWAPVSRLPHRHLLAILTLIAGLVGSATLADLKSGRKKLVFSLLMLGTIAVAVTTLFTQVMEIKQLLIDKSRDCVVSSYQPVCQLTIGQIWQKPAKILLIEANNTLDYELMIKDGRIYNQVFLLHPTEQETVSTFSQRISQTIKDNQIDYLAIDREDNDAGGLLKTLTADQSIAITQPPVITIGNILIVKIDAMI